MIRPIIWRCKLQHDGNISHIAKILKAELGTDTLKAAMSLIDFAKEYAIDNKLRYEALILKLNYIKATNTKAKEKTQQEMLILFYFKN